MRCSLFVATGILACATVAFSKEPLEGTWDIDREQTRFTTGAVLQGQTLTIERHGADFIYTVTAISAAGPQTIIKYTVPVRGGEGKFLIGSYDRVIHKRIDATTREAHYFRGGKEMMSFRGFVTHDGRSLWITVKGTDAQGNRVEGLSVYTRREHR